MHYTLYMYSICMYMITFTACIHVHVHGLYVLLILSTARKSDLGIAGFGISVTTMEEVFIKVGEGTDETLEHRYIHVHVHVFK